MTEPAETLPLEAHDPVRTGMSVEALKRAFLDNLVYVQGRFIDVATPHDYYMAAAYTVRDRLLERWIKTAQAYKKSGSRTVCYLSAEFLLGPHLANNLLNLHIVDNARQVAEELGLDVFVEAGQLSLADGHGVGCALHVGVVAAEADEFGWHLLLGIERADVVDLLELVGRRAPANGRRGDGAAGRHGDLVTGAGAEGEQGEGQTEGARHLRGV